MMKIYDLREMEGGSALDLIERRGEWVPADVAQRLYDALRGLIASHDDLTNWANDPSLGRPDIEWSIDFADKARAALAAADGDGGGDG